MLPQRPAWIALGLVAGLAGPACGPTEQPAQTSGDAPASAAASAPPRDAVVSLAPTASRFVVALGAWHLLVGVDPASAGIPELSDLPLVADLAGAAELAPDLVLLPGPPPHGDPVADALRADGVALVPFAPHDLEDVFELIRQVGGRLVGPARAAEFEAQLGRPLAAIGGASVGQPRPRVLAVVGLDPLRVAGGHSFETDLIEIAGGRSLTHGGEEPLLSATPAQIAELAPDLVLVVSPEEPGAETLQRARDVLPGVARIEPFAVDSGLFWLRDPTGPARRLRARIEPIAREMQLATSRSEAP